MACATPALFFGYVKIEDSPEPEPLLTIEPPQPRPEMLTSPIDAKDPEGFLRRCSGHNKKTKLRCSAVIGKKTQLNTHPTYLPTCSAHREQQSFAGWCQFQHRDGERCGRLFKWVPPYLELCTEHQGHPDTPCYFLKLPLELRHEVFRYLLPSKPIGSSTAVLHDSTQQKFDSSQVPYGYITRFSSGITTHRSSMLPPSTRAITNSVFPTSLLDLLLVNRQIFQEVKTLLFSIAAFTIDVRKDGAFMCGRRLLEPKRADGSSHDFADEAEVAKQKFLDTFDWSAVKNYNVDILLENWSNRTCHNSWDEEVELYDIRGMPNDLEGQYQN